MMTGTDVSELTGLAALVGRTPLLRLRRFETRPGVEIHAKLESRNPGGSVKDRAALAMVLDGERRGLLKSGRILLDATSGNTGIAYAMLGASRGFGVRLCVPANVSHERKRLLHAYGADLVLTDPMDGSDGAIREARRIHQAHPDRYFYADQYNNPANWRAHYDTTAVELIDQTDRRMTHFVAGLGTSGTFVGTGRRLREWNRDIVLVSVQPQSPLHGLEGLKHMESAIVPGIYDSSLADRDERVSTEEAYAIVLRLSREVGLLAGPSGGAALAASLRIANELERGVIVTVFPDSGDRYLSERFWDAGARVTVQYEGLRLPAAALADIHQHVARGYPDESCGALIGPVPGEVAEAFPLTNTTSLERRRRFLVGPEEYRVAERRASDTSRQLLGFYHSHPDHPAVPSAFDLEHAWPNLSYLIVSVCKGQPAESRSWRLKADRSGYDEEPIHNA